MKALKLLYFHPSWRSLVSLTIEKLKSISVSLVPYDEQRIYARLEHSLSELVAKREGLNREENLQYNLFSTLRDYLCLELLSPEITELHKLAKLILLSNAELSYL